MRLCPAWPALHACISRPTEWQVGTDKNDATKSATMQLALLVPQHLSNCCTSLQVGDDERDDVKPARNEQAHGSEPAAPVRAARAARLWMVCLCNAGGLCGVCTDGCALMY